MQAITADRDELTRLADDGCPHEGTRFDENDAD